MELSADISSVSHARVSGHFGEWLQGRMGPDGPVALVSLPCEEVWCEVAIRDAAKLIVPEHLVLTENRVVEALTLLGVSPNLSVSISDNIPAGAGLGASSAALVALIRASASRAMSPEDITRICLKIEGATDPLMQECFDTLLWASRRGETLQKFTAPPSFEVVGGLWGDAEKTDPKDTNFPDISDLVPLWDAATKTGSHREVAQNASESARRTTDLRGPDNDPTEILSSDLNALGHIRAHTGSARGLLFRPGHVPADAEARLKALGYSNIIRFMTGS